ncbi:MAG TPA: neutral zinc metallopeptidase, partial [Flavitalea sp.]|nr:neutral zinc metallopeptidase [Flavitalea sp.]
TIMLWKGRRESTNVDDRRGMSGGGLAVGGGIIGVIALLINFFLGGGDASQLPQNVPGAGAPEMSAEQKAEEDELAGFVKVVFGDTEDVWNSLLGDGQYREPRLVLFSQVTSSGCGNASQASGPFYCPADQQVYIDLSFYNELKQRFNVSGDFAMAYVIAHEVGHHIQYLMGITEKMARARQQMSETEYNQLSVKLELQADFYAGVFAHHNKKYLQAGDIEEALTAANAIGDDNLQRQAQGRVVPDAFTHGTSEQRMYWFKKGYQTGDINQGDTFSATDL